MQSRTGITSLLFSSIGNRSFQLKLILRFCIVDSMPFTLVGWFSRCADVFERMSQIAILATVQFGEMVELDTEV